MKQIWIYIYIESKNCRDHRNWQLSIIFINSIFSENILNTYYMFNIKLDAVNSTFISHMQNLSTILCNRKLSVDISLPIKEFNLSFRQLYASGECTHHEINYFIQSESSRSYMINPVNLIFPQPTAIRDPWTIIIPREIFDNALINGEFAVRTLLTWEGLVFPMYRKN